MKYRVNDLVFCDYALLPPEEALHRFLSLILHPDAIRKRRAFLEAVCEQKPDVEGKGPEEQDRSVAAWATTLTDERREGILQHGLSSSDEDRQVICRLVLDSEALGDLHAAVWNLSADNAFWHEKVEAFLAIRHEERLYSAAELFAETEWSTARIAMKLNVPRRQVSGLLREARRRKILVVTLNREPRVLPVIAPSVPMSDRWSYDELLSGLRAWSKVLQGVTVVPSTWDGRPPEETTHEMWAGRMKDFGRCAGNQLRELLAQAKHTVGVASGETVYWSIEGMPAADASPERGDSAPPTTCIATVGDLACEAAIGKEVLASTLTKKLSEVLNGGKSSRCYTLGTVEAFVPLVGINDDGHPEPLSPDEPEAVIRGYRRTNRCYRQIFGGPGLKEMPLIENLDAILTSCGSVEQPNKFWVDELIEGGVSKAEMRRLIDGDIGGVPLMNPALSDNDVALFHTILRHWTGIKEEHYRRCATNALIRKRGPGVVLVALGSNKLPTVRRCIRSGLINHLFIDLDLTQALFKELYDLKGKPASPARR